MNSFEFPHPAPSPKPAKCPPPFSSIASRIIFKRNVLFAALAAAMHTGSTYAGCVVTGTVTQHCGADYIQVYADTGTASLTVNDETTVSVELRPPTTPSGGPYNQTINLTGNTVINNPAYSGVIMQTNEANRDAAVNAGAGVSITSIGGFGGIWVRNDVSGNVTIDSSATVNATGSDGVTGTTNRGAVSVTNRGQVTTDNRGLYADGGFNDLPASPVLVSITNTGTVNSTLAGARSINYQGEAAINNSGSVTTTTRQGLVAWSNNGPASITNSGTVSAGDDNALHIMSEYGDITITNSGAVTASDDPAIVASRTGYSGIRASVDMDPSTVGANGSITITNTAAQITAASDYAIVAETPSGNIVITNTGPLSGLHGISANAVSGAVTITNSGQINATGGSGYGIDILAATSGTISNSSTVTAVTAARSDAASTLTQINNQATGVLDGRLSLLGSAALANAGAIILPANTTSTVTGSYTQNIGATAGTLKTRVNGSAQFGKLAVVGVATLPTTARIEVVTGNAATCNGISVGDTLASVISATTLTATTTAVSDDCTNIDFVVIKNSNAIDLVAGNIVNGSCGSANGSTTATAPSANLCATGSAGAVSNASPWGWSCLGTSSGTVANCSASAPTPTYDPPPSTTTLPTGGGTATLTNGQSVTVTENGLNGTAINLPPPTTTTPGTTTPANSVNVTLPGTGAIGVSSNVADTKLGVTHVTLPGAATSVSAVTVDQGSASFTATEKGQAVAGLKNGIVVVSGAKNSQITVDATGPNAKIGVKSADTIVVPTGSANVAGTKVDLPPPTASGGQAATVNLNIGGQELTVQSSQANTTMTFDVVNIGGVQTPVLAVTGNAQVTTSGEDKPIVSIAGNVIKSGKSSGGSQVCNTIVQASSDASSDVVHVVTCYIVLEPGTFSAIGGGRGNSFAAIKDGIVWAGETAEFDKNGVVTSAYVGTRQGDTDAVGDDMVPGGGKFAANGYQVGAFVPRLAGTPLRLNGAKLDESIFAVVKNALNVTVLPSTPSQSAQGVLNFNFAGNLVNQGVQSPNMTYTINGDTASVLPSRRVRVDTSRADGVSISAEGDVDVAAGGLVTTFVASVPDPKLFAEKIDQALPGSTSVLRWNGTWQVKAADGTTYVGRPLWSYWAATPGAATFSTLADGNILYSDNGIAQLLFPDFYDYDTLQATFRKDLNDPSLTVLPRMDGTAIATVNGQTYTLAPQWKVVKPAVGKPAWWVEGSVVFIKNADGSAQGFTVK